MDLKEFNHRIIAFDFDTEMVNATDVIRSFPNKKMHDYLRLKQTSQFISYLESKTGIPVLKVKHGGAEHGTWMCKMLAYDFAAWLSPEFRLFIYQTFESAVKEKLNNQQRQLDYFWDKDDIKKLYK